MTDTDLKTLKQELELAQMQGLAVFPIEPSVALDLIRALAEEVESRAEHECEPGYCDECPDLESRIEDLTDELLTEKNTVQELKATLAHVSEDLDAVVAVAQRAVHGT